MDKDKIEKILLESANTEYESPVMIIADEVYKQTMTEYEKSLMSILSNEYCIKINKDELIKALNYDRDSYCKGYNAGYTKAKGTAQWVISSDGYYPYCSACKARPREMTKYCAECGRLMRGSDEEQEPSKAATEKAKAGIQESPERAKV